MYIVLYESMLAWYERRRVASAYRHLYTVTTLTSMAFVNILSILSVGAHLNLGLARDLLIAVRSWPVAIMMAIGLLLLHLLVFRRHQSLLAPRSSTRAPWLALVYGVLSVILFFLTSELGAEALHRS